MSTDYVTREDWKAAIGAVLDRLTSLELFANEQEQQGKAARAEDISRAEKNRAEDIARNEKSVRLGRRLGIAASILGGRGFTPSLEHVEGRRLMVAEALALADALIEEAGR
jgi:hypothetical protein